MSAQHAAATDRYRSFKGIDVEGQTRRVMERIEHHTRDRPDRFWTYFHERRQARTGPRHDDLLLLASFVTQIRELFESRADALGQRWLDQLEEECF